jgi:hypothetical protein
MYEESQRMNLENAFSVVRFQVLAAASMKMAGSVYYIASHSV